MKRIISIVMAIILCISLGVTLAACGGGPSEEKVNKVKNDFAALVSEHNAVAQLYDDASAAGVQLNQDGVNSFNAAADYVVEFGEVTLDGKKDANLDEYISDIAEYRNNLKTISSQLEALIAEQQQDEWEGEEDYARNYEDEGENEDGYGDEDPGIYLTGMAGDESSIYMVGLNISSDGTQCMFAFGNPGDSLVVLGQFVDGEGNTATIYPLDGSDAIDISSSDNGDGTVSFEVFGYEGSLSPVDKDEFNELVDMLG